MPKKKDKLRLLASCGIYCGLCSSRNRMPQQARALRQTMANSGRDSLGRKVEDFKDFWRFLGRIGDPDKSCPGPPARHRSVADPGRATSGSVPWAEESTSASIAGTGRARASRDWAAATSRSSRTVRG